MSALIRLTSTRSAWRLPKPTSASRSVPTAQALAVPAGMTGKARLLLAERGLPNSANAGYELFDNVGSLGLTSFMQEVTRVRALEGEIGRTIQSISGRHRRSRPYRHAGSRKLP